MNSLCGLFYRSLDADARFYIHEIASRLSIRMACCFTHTDFHNISEDVMTISYLGGRWRIGLYCGLFYRVLYHAPSLTDETVASRSKKKYQPLFLGADTSLTHNKGILFIS